MATFKEIEDSRIDLSLGDCENLKDYLKVFACEQTYKNFRLNAVFKRKYTYDLIDSEPICRLMFYKYCLSLNPKWIDFLQLLDSLHSNTLETVAKRDTFKSHLRQLYSDLKNRDGLRTATRLMLKLIIQLDTKFDSKKVLKFYHDAHVFLGRTLFEDFILTPFFDRYLQFKSLEPQATSELGFSNFKLLSSGSFGAVYMCESVLTKTKFACKYFDKALLAKQDLESDVKNEKNILKKLDSPFALKLICMFETERSICFVTNLMCGGDLSYHIRNITKLRGLGFKRAQFYAAEIVCGLLYLQSKNIVHFDLKPKNILLDGRGHVRIGDFGLAQVFKKDKHIHSVIGTNYYIAPEILTYSLVGLAADWFSFGCIVYEMIEGLNPFVCLEATYLNKTWEKLTVNHRETYSKKFNDRSKEFCCRLLNKSPMCRMLTRPQKTWSKKIKKDKFFAGIDWKKLESGNYDVPFLPKVNKKYHDEVCNSGVFDSKSNWKPSCLYSMIRPKIGTDVQLINWQINLIKSGFFTKMTKDI